MDRIIAYPSQVPLVENFLQQQKNTSAAVGRLIEAAFGTTTSAAGLAATVSSIGVVAIAPGSLMALGVADTLQNGVLGADATPQMKQGIVNTPTTLSLSSGTLATGQSVNILVQASLAEAYAGSAVLPYYNTNSPTTPYNGSSGSGSAQPTGIACAISFSSIVGTPATSGTQVTPNAAAGCVPLYVVTWPYGGSPSIAVHPSAPLIDPSATLRGLLPGRLINRQKFTAVGVTQYVPTPGTKVAEVFALGGGGGGAGGQAVTGAMVSPGSGGTAGASGRGALRRYRACFRNRRSRRRSAGWRQRFQRRRQFLWGAASSTRRAWRRRAGADCRRNCHWRRERRAGIWRLFGHGRSARRHIARADRNHGLRGRGRGICLGRRRRTDWPEQQRHFCSCLRLRRRRHVRHHRQWSLNWRKRCSGHCNRRRIHRLSR